ncbi:MAG: hypothetical protein U1E56_06895 [Bauldia sp.]
MRIDRLNRVAALAVAFMAAGVARGPAALAQMPPAAGASGPTSLAAMAQTPLTHDRILALMASFADVKKAADVVKAKYKIGIYGGGSAVETFALLAAVAGSAAELNAAVGKYGFKDFADWLAVLTSTAIAVANAGVQPADGNLDEAIATIENSKGLSASQKESLIAPLRDLREVLPKPPRQNIDLVTPYVAELRVLLK